MVLVCLISSLQRKITHYPRAAVVHLNFRPFRFKFVLYKALWTELAGATRLTRSDFMLHIWIYFYWRGRGACIDFTGPENLKFLKAAAASKVLHICSTVISQIKFTSLELNPNLVKRFLNLNEQQYYLLLNPSQVGRYRVSHETWQLTNSFECRLKLILPNSYIIFLLLFLVLNNLTNYGRRHSKLFTNCHMLCWTPCRLIDR